MTASPTTPVNAHASDAVLARIADLLATRLPTSYVAKLFSKGPDAALKKIGEEATELVMAVKDGQADRIVAETADLWFHCLVVLTEHGLRPEQVLAELARREGVSGLQEKASRNP